MKDPQRKYPASLFWMGVAIGILRSFLWLALLALVVAVAIVKQLMYRHAVLHSDSPEFADWQDAMLSPDWRENITERVERAMNEDNSLSDDGDDNDEECDEQGEN